jgi:eukaryotic-like serine/threonine-protein kinase
VAHVANRFGAYEILYELKTGGMGSVLLGRRRGPGAFEQLVAIKTIRPEFAQTAAVRAMFLDEAAILARLNHPGVATVHDFGEQGGTLYMVMEYVAGIAFRDALQHVMPPAIAARAIAEACRGVHAAHELRDLAGSLLGVVHRDISPDNLMIGFDGHVKVIDFGIALIKNRQAPVTELGTVKGKPPYMSPEQVKNEAMDRRSDVFSLAVVLWEMLAGRALFEGDSIYAIALAVEHQELRPPSQVLGAPLPLGLDAVVMNALDRDLARRTRTAAELAEQLEQVIQTAGDETLEAWAERALDEPRAQHRAWLASIVAGRDAPRPIGRPTGAVTALSMRPDKPPAVAAPAALPVGEPPRDPAVSTHLAAMSEDEALALPPRRSLALPIILAFAVLVTVGGALYFTRRANLPPAGRDAGPAPVDAPEMRERRDAREPADAQIAVPDLPLDAPEPPEPPVLPLDAGHRRPIRPPRDAGRTASHDAEVAAAPADPAASFGAITAKHRGDRYLNVLIDGQMIGPTPLFSRRFPAGTHVVELVDPRTTEVVVKRTVKVEAGEVVTVTEP